MLFQHRIPNSSHVRVRVEASRNQLHLGDQTCGSKFAQIQTFSQCGISGETALLGGARISSDEKAFLGWGTPQPVTGVNFGSNNSVYESVSSNNSLLESVGSNNSLLESFGSNNKMYEMVGPNNKMYEMCGSNNEMYKMFGSNNKMYEMFGPNNEM